jgi:hypothetical protein
VEAVEEFDTEAKVEIGEGADTEPPLLARVADVLLGHKALSAGDLVSRSPENGAPGTVKSGQNTRREVERRHGIGRQGVQDGVEEHKPATEGEKQGAPPGEVLIHLGDERREGGESKLLGGQREPKISLGKPLHATPQVGPQFFDDAGINVHRHQRALVKVDCSALPFTKGRTPVYM